MNIAHWLARSARLHPGRPAVCLGSHCLYDYRRLADRAARIAGWLAEDCGLRPGARVALFMGNAPEYLEILYAAWWAGLAVVPVNSRLHPRELEFILADSGASILFVDPGHATAAPACPDPGHGLRRSVVTGSRDYRRALACAPLPLRERAADDLAWLFYTSGTTGRPKGVIETHRNLMAMSLSYLADVDEARPDDATVYAAPMSHGAGLYNFVHVLRAARHVVPETGGFDPDELVGLAREVGRICLFAAPTMVNRLVARVAARDADPGGFKTLVYGGGPMYVADIRRGLEVMGPRFVQIYGQGESPMTITALARAHLADRSHPRWLPRIASVGVAHSAVEVRVADAEGRPLPAGTLGEILVRGDTVMAGYWQNPEASARTLRNGWLWTGDLGEFDDDGFLTLRDRSKDLIISGGSNIYPREVEEILLEHPEVREAAVVGREDAQWGEIVVAFIVAPALAAAADPAAADRLIGELDALCLARIARFKRPKHYRFIDALPKNNYGKVLKTELRGMA